MDEAYRPRTVSGTLVSPPGRERSPQRTQRRATAMRGGTGRARRARAARLRHVDEQARASERRVVSAAPHPMQARGFMPPSLAQMQHIIRMILRILAGSGGPFGGAGGPRREGAPARAGRVRPCAAH